MQLADLLRENIEHDVADTEFLVDAGGYLTVLARHELSGQLNYTTTIDIDRINELEKLLFKLSAV
jgi:hypothetical protein